MIQQKKFITFPYPYMNGILHLGHAYTLLCADIQTRYYKMKGYKTLFPFGFHGSGMPIVACANKLKHELEKYGSTPIGDIPSNTQIKILIDMEIKYEELNNFIEPEYWVKYFSENAMNDLKDFNIDVDFSRSFYTTKMNSYYDAFINWQFKHLMKDGYVFKGKRYVIYSIKDRQPCADHDRRIGEGVKPTQMNTKIIKTKYGNLLCLASGFSKVTKVFINSRDEFIKFKVNNNELICNKYAYDNISNQMENSNKEYKLFTEKINKEDIEVNNEIEIEYINIDIDFGTGFYICENIENILKDYYMIEGENESIFKYRTRGKNVTVFIKNKIYQMIFL